MFSFNFYSIRASPAASAYSREITTPTHYDHVSESYRSTLPALTTQTASFYTDSFLHRPLVTEMPVKVRMLARYYASMRWLQVSPQCAMLVRH